MSLNDFSNIVVTTGGAALSQVGFGTLLCACHHNYFADMVREYTNANDLVNDGFPTDHPAYAMLSAGFAQRPKPKKIKLGKLTSRPTQTITITPNASVGTNYVIKLAVDDRDPVTISVASGTVDAVCDALEAAINAAALDEITVTPDGGTATELVLTVAAGHVMTFFGWSTTHMTVEDATPGQTIRLTPTALNNTVYSVEFYCQGFTGASGIAEYTSDASATVDEICDGLQAAILALGLPGATVVPSGGTATYIDVCMTSGRLLFMNDWDDTRLSIEDRTQDPGIAADLAVLRLADSDWYGLAIDCNASDVIEEAADWAETELLMFGYNNSDTAAGTSGTTDIFSVLKGKAYARSIGIFNGNDTGAYGGVRMLAERFPHDPGARGAGGTFHAKTLRGQTADTLTSTQKTQLRAKNAVVYIVTAGRSHTLDGKTASGEFADKTRFLDWFTIRLQERIAQVELDNDVVPYDETGLAMFRSACEAQLAAGRKTGGIAATDADGNPPTVTVPALADTEEIDRAARVLRDIEISFRLAGAIHMVDPVNVTASV